MLFFHNLYNFLLCLGVAVQQLLSIKGDQTGTGTQASQSPKRDPALTRGKGGPYDPP